MTNKLVKLYVISLSMIGAILLLLPAIIISIPLPRNPRHFVMTMMWRVYSRFLLKIVFLSPYLIIDHRSDEQKKRQALYISNHKSFADVPFVALICNAYVLMKFEVLYIPIIGIAAYMNGATPVRRKSKESRSNAYKKIVAHMEAGRPILYFPEGTRSRTETPKGVSEIHRPLLAKAYKLGVPVAPVSLYGTDHIMSKSGKINLHKKSGAIVGELIDPKQFAKENDFITVSWAQVHNGFSDLKRMIES